jgi:hypothetical protein
MNKHLLFLSTDENSLGSALIRRLTMCDWSHVGFYRKSDGWTFSAMNDGKGVAWRGPNPQAKLLLLEVPRIDEIADIAFSQEGKPYNRVEIAGFALNQNLSEQESFDCCQLVFWSAIKLGMPLLNHTFIPLEHLTPRDTLLSPLVRQA